jgi:hypothetical protein
MTDQNQQPIRARPWKRPPDSGRASAPRSPYRFVLRLLVLPILAVAGVFIYRGVRDRLVLPECDSDRAKKSLTQVLDQFNYKPTKFEPITTLSAAKDQVVCNALLPLPDGATVDADFTFYWQGGTASMRYSVSRKAPGETPAAPVAPPIAK